MMSSAQVIKTSLNAITTRPSQDYTDLDDKTYWAMIWLQSWVQTIYGNTSYSLKKKSKPVIKTRNKRTSNIRLFVPHSMFE